MTSVKEMWNTIKDNVTKKSTLQLLDAEEQLQTMKLEDNNDSKSHLMELKQHFQLIVECCDNLLKMRSMLSDMIIMSSYLAPTNPLSKP